MPRNRRYRKRQRKRERPYGRRPRRYPPRETKFLDLLSVNALNPPSKFGTIYASTIVTVNEGTEKDQRIGRKIHLTGMGFKLTGRIPTGTTDNKSSDEIRVVIYQDKQANGLPAIVSDIYADVVPPTSPEFVSFRNLTKVNRFKILYDRVHHIQSKGSASAVAGVITHADASMAVQWWTDLDFNVLFSGVTGNMANITENNIGILMFSVTEATSISIHTRIRYLDM